jgi:hypothetical protein
MIFPVLVGRESSLKAAYKALDREKYIFITAQKDPSIESRVLTISITKVRSRG